MESNVHRSDVRRTLTAAKEILKGLNTPIALSMYLLLGAVEQGDRDAWDQLVNKTLQPSNYDSVEAFRLDYQAVMLMRKAPNIFDLNLSEAAIGTFFDSEYACWSTNQDVLYGSLSCWHQEGFRLHQLKRQLRKILGRAPSWESVVEKGGWGPGATVSLKKSNASPEIKSGFERSCTLPLARKLAERDVHIPWLKDYFKLVPGNIIVTVPKNAKTDRTIAKEPGINSWCQKGIGFFIRRRLRKFGVNLNDQSVNAALALLAESSGYSTLDLKAASGSMAVMLFDQILDPDWHDLIFTSRSPRYSFDGKQWFEYQQLSSMGNGYTFELESALFLAICMLSVPSSMSTVYGDDIIVPSSDVKSVINNLELFGFSVNLEKSFTEGYFYESCGVHSFQGVDVTPIQIKEVLSGTKDIIVLANKIRLYAHLYNHYCGCWSGMLPAWRRVRSWLEPRERAFCRGPVGSGLTLYVNQDEAVHSKYLTHYGRFKTYQWVPTTKAREGSFEGLLWYRLWSLSQGSAQFLLHTSFSALWTLYQLGFSEVLNSVSGESNSGNVIKTTAIPNKGSIRPAYTEVWYDLGVWQ